MLHRQVCSQYCAPLQPKEPAIPRRLTQLTVRMTTSRDCWAALPAALMSRLLDSGAPMPLVLELRPSGPAGPSHQIRCQQRSALSSRLYLRVFTAEH